MEIVICVTCSGIPPVTVPPSQEGEGEEEAEDVFGAAGEDQGDPGDEAGEEVEGLPSQLATRPMGVFYLLAPLTNQLLAKWGQTRRRTRRRMEPLGQEQRSRRRTSTMV